MPDPNGGCEQKNDNAGFRSYLGGSELIAEVSI
jgi:hypothetical protein